MWLLLDQQVVVVFQTCRFVFGNSVWLIESIIGSLGKNDDLNKEGFVLSKLTLKWSNT